MFSILAILTATIVVLQLTKHWLLSKGALWWVYRLNLVIFTAYFITETMVGLNNPEQLPLLFMNIVNVWGFTMSYIGMKRLHKESDAEILEEVKKAKEECL